MATHDEIVSVWNMMHTNYSYFQREMLKRFGGDEEKAAEELGKLLSGIWIPILETVPGETLKSAAMQYVANGNLYFPQVGELRNLALEIQDVANADEVDPFNAWREVMRAMKGSCAYAGKPIEWSDQFVGMAVEAIGGMRAIRFSDERSLPVLMSQFVRAYKDLRGRAKRNDRFLPQVKDLVARMSFDNMLAVGRRAELSAPVGDGDGYDSSL